MVNKKLYEVYRYSLVNALYITVFTDCYSWPSSEKIVLQWAPMNTQGHGQGQDAKTKYR